MSNDRYLIEQVLELALAHVIWQVADVDSGFAHDGLFVRGSVKTVLVRYGCTTPLIYFHYI